MKFFIDRGEWVFVAVKGATLLLGWAVLTWYSKTNLAFVKKVAYAGSAAYVSLWVMFVYIYR